LPDILSAEDSAFTPAAVQSLTAMGYRVRMRGDQGTAHSIRVDPRTGMRRGAADPRDTDAGAAGY
jgi:gamma-glutamyltranspeptidase/glutathione hydrolase